MSENTEHAGYDPAEDPDADPEQLSPRTGSQAGGDGEAGNDPDSDRDSMNPREQA